MSNKQELTIDWFHEHYGLKDTADLIKKEGLRLHPTYKKWLPACWLIESVYGHVEQGNISLGKARELTSAIIESHLKESVAPQEPKQDGMVAIKFAKWIKSNWRIEKGRYRHRGDFYKNSKNLPNEEYLWDCFIKEHSILKESEPKQPSE